MEPERIWLQKCVWIYVLAALCEGSEPQKKAPVDARVVRHFKGPRGRRDQGASPPARGEILFVVGPRLADAAANAAARNGG